MKKNHHIKQKGSVTKIIDENNKWLVCVTYVKYNLKNGNISITNNIVYNGSYVRIGLMDDKKNRFSSINNRLYQVSDGEVRKKVKEILTANPRLSISEVANKTGFSKYKLNRIYMTVKRKVC